MEESNIIKKPDKIGQEQFHSFVFNDDMSWQEIIYDLINTEQLDPWDISLTNLATKYLEKISKLEEANFILGSKVLLVASLLLKMKSCLIMDRYIQSLDKILFNSEEKEKQEVLPQIEYDEGEIPELILKTPLPRFRKISIDELISALNKAINTEERREIKKIIEKQAEERIKLFMPKKTISLKDSIRNIHDKIKSLFQTQDKIKFSEFAGATKQEKINTFIPLLHLDNHNKLWLHQPEHFKEIWIHKNGEEFIQKDDIITSRIEEKFEEELENKE